MWHTNISPPIYMPSVNEQKEKAANTLHIEKFDFVGHGGNFHH